MVTQMINTIFRWMETDENVVIFPSVLLDICCVVYFVKFEILLSMILDI